MKRSQIFASLLTIVLASLGALANANNFTTNTYWYKAGISETCTSVQVEFSCVEDPVGGCLGIAGNSSGQQLYVTDDCDRKLRIP